MAIFNIKSFIEYNGDKKIITYRILGIPVLRHTRQYENSGIDRSATSSHLYP